MTAWGKRADMIVHESEPYNAESSRAALAESDITPVDAFYSRNHGPVPVIDPQAWRLRIDGLVGTPLELSLHDLRTRFPHHELAATLQCAGNRRVGFLAVRDIPDEAPWGPGATSSARWTGVRLADVLTAAGPTRLAAHVAFEAPDLSELTHPPERYGSSIPLSKACAGEVLLAWGMKPRCRHCTAPRFASSSRATSARAASSGSSGSPCRPSRRTTTSRPRPTGYCHPTPTRTRRGRAPGCRSEPSR